jgi:predicted methyltransferase
MDSSMVAPETSVTRVGCIMDRGKDWWG